MGPPRVTNWPAKKAKIEMRSLIHTVKRQIQALSWWVIERTADREGSTEPAISVEQLLENLERKPGELSIGDTRYSVI